MNRLLFATVAAAVSLSPIANAQDDGNVVITTAVPFLQIEPDSRSAGMGMTGVAVADNAYAPFWNPAGLAGQEGTEVSLTHAPWLPALGADLTLPPSMQADVAEYEYFKSKRDRTGLIFSAWSMSTKLALAFSALIAFPLLEWAGTVSTNASTGSEKTYDPFVLAMIYAGLPVVLKVFAIALMWRHPLDRARQSILQRRLSALESRQTVRE